MATGAAIAGGLGAVGSYFGSREQAQAADESAQVQREMYQQTREDLGPYREFGQQALNPLFETAMGAAQFDENHPVWKAINRSRAAQGVLGSGGTLQSLADYYGTTYQPQRFAQLYDIAGMGQNAAAQTGVAGSSAAANIGNSLMASGDARATGIAGIGNSFQNALGQYYYLQGLQGGGGQAFGTFNTGIGPLDGGTPAYGGFQMPGRVNR